MAPKYLFVLALLFGVAVAETEDKYYERHSMEPMSEKELNALASKGEIFSSEENNGHMGLMQTFSKSKTHSGTHQKTHNHAKAKTHAHAKAHLKAHGKAHGKASAKAAIAEAA